MTEQPEADYLDPFVGIKADIHGRSQLDESSTVTTTYLGIIEMSRKDALKVQEQFLLTDQSTTMGTLPDGTDCRIL